MAGIEDLEQKQFQIRFRLPTKFPSVVAQYISVQPDVDGVLLSFFELIPPMIPDDITDEQLKTLQAAGVPAECVSKVYIPLSRYEDIVNVMSSIILKEDETEKVGKEENQ